MLQIQCKMSRDATSVSNPSPYSIYGAMNLNLKLRTYSIVEEQFL